MGTHAATAAAHAGLKSYLDRYERRIISAALAASHGHQRRAAAALGVKPTTLNEKIKRLGIAAGEGDFQPANEDEPGREFAWSGLVSDGQVIEVQGTVGEIVARGAAGPLARVRALRHGDEGARRVAVNVLEHEDGVIFSVHQVRSSAPAAATFVRFELAVPPATRLVLRLQSGDIEIVGVRGRVEAHTVNGTVRRVDETA